MNAPAPTITAVGRAGTTGVLVAMCTCLVLVVASVAALNLALPDLAVDLSASTTSLTWSADGYTVALAALVLPLGALGDRIGSACAASPSGPASRRRAPSSACSRQVPC